jgi:hypothetical protein
MSDRLDENGWRNRGWNFAATSQPPAKHAAPAVVSTTIAGSTSMASPSVHPNVIRQFPLALCDQRDPAGAKSAAFSADSVH